MPEEGQWLESSVLSNAPRVLAAIASALASPSAERGGPRTALLERLSEDAAPALAAHALWRIIGLGEDANHRIKNAAFKYADACLAALGVLVEASWAAARHIGLSGIVALASRLESARPAGRALKQPSSAATSLGF